MAIKDVVTMGYAGTSLFIPTLGFGSYSVAAGGFLCIQGFTITPVLFASGTVTPAILGTPSITPALLAPASSTAALLATTTITTALQASATINDCEC
jgi:hypothetical protein